MPGLKSFERNNFIGCCDNNPKVIDLGVEKTIKYPIRVLVLFVAKLW